MLHAYVTLNVKAVVYFLDHKIQHFVPELLKLLWDKSSNTMYLPPNSEAPHCTLCISVIRSLLNIFKIYPCIVSFNMTVQIKRKKYTKAHCFNITIVLKGQEPLILLPRHYQPAAVVENPAVVG